MPFADLTRIDNRIKEILNLASEWAGAIENSAFSNEGVIAARTEAGLEVLRAIAANPQNGHYAAAATLVSIAHNAFLPAHDGEPGIPIIRAFDGGPLMEGRPATPDEIDSYRMDPGSELIYSGGADGDAVAHNEADANNLPSPVAGFYSIVNGRFKFTGFSAEIPLIQVTRAMAETVSAIPEMYESTVIKLAVPKLTKVGHAGHLIADRFLNAGMVDLKAIAEGAMSVPPVPDVVMADKAGVI